MSDRRFENAIWAAQREAEYQAAERAKAAEERPGTWVAFNYDGSAFVPFATEIEALRYAIDFHMPVKFAEFGDPDWMRK